MEICPTDSNSSKKRKICREEDEEAKMETFFALVRSIRETRDRWIGDSKKKSKEEKSVKVWKPKFQLEDFANEHGNQEPALALLGGASHSKKEEEDAEKGIDLRLSL